MGRKVAKVLAGIFAVILILLTIVLIKTVLFTSKQVKAETAGDFTVDAKSASQRLSDAIKISTISYENNADFKGAEFLKFHIYLERSFPQLHKALKKEVINKYSLLYTWPGRDLKLKPAVFIAHMDVVPVEEKTIKEWKYEPFEGRIAEGYIWGRGTLDNKSNLLGIMEAVEGLLAKGFQPKQTIYIVSGHDEEVGGSQGAVKIAELFKSRGFALDYVIDEGMVITDGVMPGIAARAGLVGIAEKGIMNVELRAKGAGGHSSMPPRETTVGILCKAITKLENNPFPARLDGPAKYLFDYAGREMSFPNKIIFANLWLTEGLLKGQLQKSNTTNAMIRTTTAPTVLEGSNKNNVMPNIARAVVNFRILPGDTPESVLEHVRKTVNDPRIEIRAIAKEIQPPSPVADIDSKNFRAIQKSIRQIFPDVIVAPALAIAASDSRHFTGLTRDIYKFSPQIFRKDDTGRLHGINERIALDNYTQLIKFYMQLITNS